MASKVGVRPDVLFMLYPTHGHVTPNLAVVAELIRRGWRVRVMVSDEFAGAIERTGATPIGFDPPLAPLPSLVGMTAEKWAVASQDVFLGVIKATPAIERVVAEDRPDLVAFDSALWAPARVVTAKLGVPAVQLTPTVIAHEPFTPEAVRDGEPDPEAEQERLAGFAVALSGVFDENGFPGTSAELFAARPGEQVIAYVPKEFQPDAARFDGRYTFAGPCLAASQDATSWQPPAHRPPVLLLSLGTTSNDRLDVFTDCIDAFADSPWHVVITLGSRFDPADLAPLPANVEAHQWIRHVEVLKYASGYVSQAGMGSVMEALAFAVPVVAVPSHPEAIANSRRLTELGLGCWLPAGQVTGAAVRKAVDTLAADATVASRLDWMRNSIRQAGGATTAADVLEKVVEAARD